MEVRGFFEYKLEEGKQEAYRELIPRLRDKRTQAGLMNYSVCESVDQKNLVVETFLAPSIEEYRDVEAKLLKDPETVELLNTLDTYIVGGAAAKKVWFFAELNFSQGKGTL
ncbi:hypothetical protein EV586_105228 [Tumebacillus sp. BK434]|uniref:hypothetical protein n=1 Tax=Tumebacillus sp. BK434 TaxID=2512169 RepID=UPI001050D1E4|nr:hypothetical protein [Tumebacillus sp. BK434]TCP53882.1 hypothetical protein EV586_105228 [Tumebacillus sp. BK434]